MAGSFAVQAMCTKKRNQVIESIANSVQEGKKYLISWAALRASTM